MDTGRIYAFRPLKGEHVVGRLKAITGTHAVFEDAVQVHDFGILAAFESGEWARGGYTTEVSELTHDAHESLLGASWRELSIDLDSLLRHARGEG